MRFTASNLSCGYASKCIVKDVNMEVKSGEVLCVLGPNGSGKSTLFKTLLGLLKLQAGDILLDGETIVNWPRPRIAQIIGYIPQAHEPPFPFRVLDVVLMGRTAHLSPFALPGKEDFRIALECIDALNISYLRDKIYTEISGGERQLVLIARALAQKPQLLIMDEPTSNLDFGNQIMVLKHVQVLADMGLGVIMASHFPEHAFLYSTKVVLIKNGEVFNAGSPEEVMTKENLEYLYGVKVNMLETSLSNGKRINVCIPQ